MSISIILNLQDLKVAAICIPAVALYLIAQVHYDVICESTLNGITQWRVFHYYNNNHNNIMSNCLIMISACE